MNAFLLLPAALAMPWNGANPTPEAGLLAMNGMSPRPTPAPAFENIPRELLKKRASQPYIYPPPKNWCGFESGIYSKLNHLNPFKQNASKILSTASPINCPELLICSLTGNFGNYGACCETDKPCTYYTSCVDTCTVAACATGVQVRYWYAWSSIILFPSLLTSVVALNNHRRLIAQAMSSRVPPHEHFSIVPAI